MNLRDAQIGMPVSFGPCPVGSHSAGQGTIILVESSGVLVQGERLIKFPTHPLTVKDDDGNEYLFPFVCVVSVEPRRY